MKKKKRSVKSTKARADQVFSELVRRSNADENGYCKCCTCGAVVHWTKIQNGHYKSRRHNNTRFDKRNCGPQCPTCNMWESGRGYEFGKYLVEKYGEQVIDELNSLARVNKSFAVEELDEMIVGWKIELSQL